MSTTDQLQSQYYQYVCYYIYQMGESGANFSLADIGQGIFISNWFYTDITQPTDEQLLAYTLTDVTNYFFKLKSLC